MAIFNPTFDDFEQVILMPRAAKETEHSTVLDRQAVQEEVARISAQFAAPNFERRRLDTQQFLQENPIVGLSIAGLKTTEPWVFLEALGEAQQQALLQVEIMQQDSYFSTLAILATYTAHVSYGVWSDFTTCVDRHACRYIGIGGSFYKIKAQAGDGCGVSEASMLIDLIKQRLEHRLRRLYHIRMQRFDLSAHPRTRTAGLRA